MSALSDLLVDNLPQGWSHRQVGREARKRGFSISDATATKYLGGRHGRPDPDTIAGFAATLRIPLREVREAAGLPREPGLPWVPPVEASDLDDEQRRILDSLVKVMARDARKAGGGDGKAASMNVVSEEGAPAPDPARDSGEAPRPGRGRAS